MSCRRPAGGVEERASLAEGTAGAQAERPGHGAFEAGTWSIRGLGHNVGLVEHEAHGGTDTQAGEVGRA